MLRDRNDIIIQILALANKRIAIPYKKVLAEIDIAHLTAASQLNIFSQLRSMGLTVTECENIISYGREMLVDLMPTTQAYPDSSVSYVPGYLKGLTDENSNGTNEDEISADFALPYCASSNVEHSLLDLYATTNIPDATEPLDDNDIEERTLLQYRAGDYQDDPDWLDSGRDLLGYYNDSIQNIPRLTRAEEIQLSEAIKIAWAELNSIISELPIYRDIISKKSATKRKSSSDGNVIVGNIEEDNPDEISDTDDDCVLDDVMLVLLRLSDLAGKRKGHHPQDISSDEADTIKSATGMGITPFLNWWPVIDPLMMRIIDARNAFVEHNQRLLLAVVNKFHTPWLDPLDLIQEANVGLLRAATHYDHTRAKFSTYAMWWMRQAIMRALKEKSGVIYRPSHIAERQSIMDKTEVKLMQETHREPTSYEIAEAMNIRAEKIDLVKMAGKTQYVNIFGEELSVEDLLFNEFLEYLEISHPLSEDQIPIADTVIDPQATSPFDYVRCNELKGLVNELLKTLTPKEQSVVKMRFGIGMKDEMTLQEAGDLLSLTRERVRQIEGKTLDKFKRGSRLDFCNSIWQDELGKKVILPLTGKKKDWKKPRKDAVKPSQRHELQPC